MNPLHLLNLLMLAWTASELFILFKTRTRNSTGEVHDRGSLLILWPTICVSIYLGTWFGDRHPHTLFGVAPWLPFVALGLFVIGLVIRWTAILALGRSFSANVAIHATQTLHNTGIFRIVRHPSYSGLLLIFVAIGMGTRSWIGLALVAVPTTAALLYRIHVEEAALGRAFGQQYAEYSRSTHRLIPGIY